MFFFLSAGNQVKTVETHTIAIYFWIKKRVKYIERKSMNLQYLMRYIQKSCTKPPTLLEGILSV